MDHRTLPDVLEYSDTTYNHGAYDGFKTSAVILDAIETLTGASLLDEDSPAVALWADDPDARVAAYLLAQYTAEDGCSLPWGVGSLEYRDGKWQ